MAERKTDRRTLYTQMVIKDALLELLGQKEYSAVTVTDICRTAEISRGTFYLHYKNIPEILDGLYEDVLARAAEAVNRAMEGEGDRAVCGTPLCLLLRKNRALHPLFFSQSLRDSAIERVVRWNEKNFSGLRGKKSDAVLRGLLTFQLHGCFAACQRMLDSSDREWERVRQVIDLSLERGYQALAER